MNESGTFCPRCGKLRNHPDKEDKTITAGLEVDVPWYEGQSSSDGFYIFVNHCQRCGYVMHLICGPALPDDDTAGPRSLETGKETFDSFTLYKDWLQEEYEPMYFEEGMEEPVEVDTASLLKQLE